MAEQKQGIISRRSMLMLGVGALTTTLTPASGGAIDTTPTTQPTVLETEDRKVSILSSGQPEFSTRLAALFPGLESDSAFASLMPVSILLEHHSGPGLRAYALMWHVSTATGSYSAPLYRYSHVAKPRKLTPSTPSTAKMGKRTNLTAQNDLLQAGDTRLITPFFTLSSQAYAKSPTAWQAKVVPREPATFLISELRAGGKVSVSLDTAIFSDRQVLGPGISNMADRLTTMRTAEHDEAVSILRLKKRGASESAIKQVLENHRTRDLPVGVSNENLWYAQYRRRYSQALYETFGSIPPHKFRRTLKHVATRKRLVLLKQEAFPKPLTPSEG